MTCTPLFRCAATLAALTLTACSSDNGAAGSRYDFDFTQGVQQWSAGFADYPAGQEDFYELTEDYGPLPEELGSQQNALFIAGNNHSDDLFMFYARRIDGLLPGRAYTVHFEVEIATEAQRDCFGAGGAPGESVYLKAGASNIEPRAAANDEGYMLMNIDKGDQAAGGAHALVLGNIANSQICGTPQRFERKTLSSAPPGLRVTTDGSGAVWLLVGTDSGFEATTRLYYTRFVARFSD